MIAPPAPPPEYQAERQGVLGPTGATFTEAPGGAGGGAGGSQP
jgi:hypothetical protein